MATRGCTSSAARRVAQVCLMSCTVIRRTPALAQRVSKRRFRFRGSNGVPARVVNTSPTSDPGGACRRLRGGLVLLADPQCRHADARHRQGGLRGLGLGFPVQELATDPLELPADIQLSPIQVHGGPGQADHLALAQAHHEDQHVRGVERILVPLCRLQELARFLGCPRLHFPRTGFGDVGQAGDVLRDQVLGDGIGQRAAQDRPGVPDGPFRSQPPTASCRNLGAAAALFLRSAGVLALRAALAGIPQLVEPASHVAQGELVEPLGAEAGQDVQPRERLVGRAGQRRIIRRDNHLAKPVSHVLGQGRRAGRHWPAAGAIVQFQPLAVNVLAGLAVDPLPAPFAVRSCYPYIGRVAVAVREDRALSVRPLPTAGHHAAPFASCLTHSLSASRLTSLRRPILIVRS